MYRSVSLSVCRGEQSYINICPHGCYGIYNVHKRLWVWRRNHGPVTEIHLFPLQDGSATNHRRSREYQSKSWSTDQSSEWLQLINTSIRCTNSFTFHLNVKKSHKSQSSFLVQTFIHFLFTWTPQSNDWSGHQPTTLMTSLESSVPVRVSSSSWDILTHRNNSVGRKTQRHWTFVILHQTPLGLVSVTSCCVALEEVEDSVTGSSADRATREYLKTTWLLNGMPLQTWENRNVCK